MADGLKRGTARREINPHEALPRVRADRAPARIRQEYADSVPRAPRESLPGIRTGGDRGMTADTIPRRLDVRHLRNHALRAIAERLKYSAPDALLAVERVGSDVILRLNSGGNCLAVESWLNLRGYAAEDAGTNPGGYGGSVRVKLRKPAGEVPGDR